MRKITALMIMLCMAAVLSAGSWFTTYGAAYNVDLSDDRTFCGISTSEPAYGSTPGYSDATHIAIAGVQDTSSESIIHITFNTLGKGVSRPLEAVRGISYEILLSSCRL